ncbi:MAG TPA: peptide ABC transporter substrate-binding protein [Anaerolineales bacterium]|nr:peptide ABC transporter substrate-binding protein [Anaerolineales bacterium]
MKNLRWQILIVVLALVAIAVLLIGQQPTLLPIVPEIKPATGGEYTEGLVGSLGRLNPVLDFYNPADRDVDRLIYSSLVRFDDRGAPVNDLIESMGISQDGTIYNFSLRRGVIWHDGKPLTSADVVFTIDLLRSAELPIPEDIRALWEVVEVQALDEQTLQFRLPEPYAPFMDYLAFGILPQHLLGDLTPEELIASQFNLEPVGSGPYRFDHLITAGGQIAGVALTAFEDYYAEPAFIEQLIFRYFPDSPPALSAYQAGEVMGVSQVTPDALPAALGEANLNLYSGRLPLLSMIFLNLDNPEVPFFQDVNLRRALLMGLNRQRMIDELLDGQAIIADGPIFPGSWAYYEGIERIPHDPDSAIKILKEAGYTIPASGGNVREDGKGHRLSFEMLYPDDPRYKPFAEWIASDWERLGVGVELKPLPYTDLVSDYLEPRTFQVAFVDLNLTRSPDPDPYPFWHQAQATGGQNYSKWDDRQASEYLEQARVEVDIAERTRLYHNFQVRFAGELPALPLFYPVYNYAVDEQVQGVTMGPLFDTSDRLATISQWFLLAERAAETQATPTEVAPATTP